MLLALTRGMAPISKQMKIRVRDAGYTVHPYQVTDMRNEVTGAVEILNKQGGESFNDDDRMLLEEMAHFLELTIENIFFNQETANVLDDIHKMMKKVVFVSIAIIISLVVIFSIF